MCSYLEDDAQATPDTTPRGNIWACHLARYATLTHDVHMPTETEALIGTAEAARILGKSPRTVHRLVAAGKLVPAIVAPGGYAGSYLFRREDVQALANEVAA